MSQNIDPTQLDTRPYDRRMEEYLKMAIPGFARDNEPRYTNAMTAMFDRIVPGLMGGKQDPNSRPANAMTAMVDHMMKNSQGMAQGGPVRYAEGGDTESGMNLESSMNLDELPSLNINIIGKPSESNSDQMPGVLGNMGAGLWDGGTGPWNSNPWGRSTPASAPAQPKSYALNLNSGKQEAQYAQGGPIRYAEGGDTESSMNLDELPSPNLSNGSSGQSEGFQRVLTGFGELSERGPSPGHRMVGDFMSGLLSYDPVIIDMIRGGNLKGKPKSYALNVESGKQEPQYAHGGEVQHFAESGLAEGDNRTFGEDFSTMQRYITNLPGYLLKPFMELAAKTSAKQAYDTLTKNYPSMPKDVFADKKAGVDMKAPTTIPGTGVLGSQAAADKMFGAQYDPSQSIGYKGAPSKEAPSAAIGSAYDEEKVRNIGDYAKELQDYLGPDKNTAAQRERLAKMEGRAARMEQQAPWLALTEAGFGAMAGTSPFALTNFGAGAQMGLKSYGAAQDKLAALEEKRMSIVMNIDQAERREKLAVAEFGAKSKEAAQERNFKRKLQREHDNTLKQMNADDNIKALMAAQIKSQPTITESLKVKEWVDQNMPQEEKFILSGPNGLGKGSSDPESKNFSAYTDRMKAARLKLEKEAVRRPGVPEVSGVPVTTSRAKFLGFE
jgi:hypothetical protein